MTNIQAIQNDIFGKSLPTLRETAVMASKIRQDFKAETAQQGEVLKFSVPRALTVKDVTPGANSIQGESTVATTKEFALDKWKMADFTLTEKQMDEVVMGSTKYATDQVAEAVRSVANFVNGSILDLAVNVPNVYISAGQLFADLKTTDAVGAAGKLNRSLCHKSRRNLVLSNDSWDRALLVPNYTNNDAFGSREVVMDGKISTASGFAWDREDAIGTFTPTGTDDNTVNGVNAKDSLILNMTTVGTLPGVGDVISIAGFTFNGQPKTYAVVAVNGSALTLNEPLIAATAGAELVTVSGVAGTEYEQNLAFHADAFGIASRMQVSKGGQNDTRTQIVDPVTGLALMLTVEQQYKQWRWEVSTLYGVGNLLDGCATRVFGTL